MNFYILFGKEVLCAGSTLSETTDNGRSSLFNTLLLILKNYYKRKTWKGKMIKNILIRRKESNTYLATVSRHRWSSKITMKNDEIL